MDTLVFEREFDGRLHRMYCVARHVVSERLSQDIASFPITDVIEVLSYTTASFFPFHSFIIMIHHRLRNKLCAKMLQ